MKLFFKVLGFVVLTCLIICYLCFLFVLPKKLDLNTYISDIQTLVGENTNFKLEIKNLKLYTNPLLSVGVKANDVKVLYDDGSALADIPNADVRIAPLSLLLLTVKSPSIVVDSPSITLDIPDGKQLKILSVIEDMANRNITLEKEAKDEGEEKFDPKTIKIKLSKIIINNYTVTLKDNKTNHDITLKGDNLVGYYDGDKIKIKTIADISNNGNKAISSNIDLGLYLPQDEQPDNETESAVALAFPYINPVREFEKVNPRANIEAKIRINPREDKLWARGYVNADDVSAKFSNYQLPKSYIHAIFRGRTVDLDSDIAYADNQRIKLDGNFNYGNGPWINMSLLTDKLYFNNMLHVTKAIMDTYGVKNNIDELVGSGYFQSDLTLKTNFKNLDSQGYLNVKDGSISNKNFGNLVADINGSLEFDKRIMKISKTKAVVHGSNFKLEGNIDDKSNLDININLEKMPLMGFILKFAPKEIKNNYRIQQGLLTLKAKIDGKISKPLCKLVLELDNLVLKDIKNNIIYFNKNNKTVLNTNFKDSEGKVINSGFEIEIPETKSTIKNEKLTINIGNENITIMPSNLLFNARSSIGFMGEVLSYKKEPSMKVDMYGAVHTSDLNKFLGPQNAVFMAAKGALPLRVFVRGNEKTQKVVFQMMANNDNYYTPINIKSIIGKPTLVQANIKSKNGALNIKNTGLYIKENGEKLTSDYESNAQNAEPVIEAHGTLIGLDTSRPSINVIKVSTPKDLNINLALFKNSSAILSIKTFLYGTFENIKTSGKIKISKLLIPEIKTTLDESTIELDQSLATINVNKLNLDNSDINLNSRLFLHEIPLLYLDNLLITSNYIDLDKLLAVVEKLNDYITPKNVHATNTKPKQAQNIPVLISSGNISLRKIKTGSINVDNTRGNLTLKNNILSIKNLYTQIFKGNVIGGVDVNLLNNKIAVDVKGSKIDVAHALLEAANVKDALTGTASFSALLNLGGATYEEQVKNLKGAIIFNIKDGSFGPFGKLENLILAENIRESEFFQTALGGIVSSLATIDTAHYDTLEGVINLNNGIANIEAIKSTGNVMSLLIFGDMNILENDLDVKVRGRLASNISDMLGPIAVLNPINLVKQAPGINIVFAKAFSLFTVPVTKEELSELPSFSSGHSDENATGFQIVLSGDVNKPLRLIKSFKWLASTEDIERAQAFLKNLIQIEQQEEEEQARRDRFNVFKKIKNAINKDEE